jgi:hypothetical protein
MWLVSCGSQQSRLPALGQAYVGPTTLPLRHELSTTAAVSATVRHGEELDVLEYKRRFVKVRTAGGIVGWTDIRQLLTPEQMAELRRMAGGSAQLPSQGIATSYEILNVHTEPSRQSPSFLQIPEGGKVEVIGHKTEPRTQPATYLQAPPPKPRTPRHKKDKNASKIPPPPMPSAPTPPVDWLALSKTPEAKVGAASTAKPGPPPAPVPKDDWSLIRTKDGKVGWVLTRMISMAIPDEVAQYAEGHRITSYFAMGDVKDDDQVKHNWLWTTIAKGPQPYEFDCFRFFIWSRRHHRYETAYIERDVVGHYPVEVNASAENPTFTLILDDDNGQTWKKTYAFNGYRVHLIDTAPYQASPAGSTPASTAIAETRADQKDASWYEGVKQRLTHLFRR